MQAYAVYLLEWTILKQIIEKLILFSNSMKAKDTILWMMEVKVFGCVVFISYYAFNKYNFSTLLFPQTNMASLE